MHLFLLRHGEADTTNPDNNLHSLSETGRKQVQAFARRIDPAIFSRITAIEHSTLRRAHETAELLRQTADLSHSLKELDGITPDSNPVPVASQVSIGDKDRFLVGHNPYLSRLISILLTGNPDSIEFSIPPSTCIALERYSGISASHPYGFWRLLWFLPPFLSPIAE